LLVPLLALPGTARGDTAPDPAAVQRTLQLLAGIGSEYREAFDDQGGLVRPLDIDETRLLLAEVRELTGRTTLAKDLEQTFVTFRSALRDPSKSDPDAFGRQLSADLDQAAALLRPSPAPTAALAQWPRAGLVMLVAPLLAAAASVVRHTPAGPFRRRTGLLTTRNEISLTKLRPAAYRPSGMPTASAPLHLTMAAMTPRGEKL
jgi:hypothetical protein